MKAPTKEFQESSSPKDVIAMLREGNARFVKNERRMRDLLEQVDATKGGQAPLAAIVGCIDSRVAPEYVFDQPIGAIFSVRLAGNVVNTDVLGSLEFSCKVAGSKLVVVLGHERCGAVMGACDGVHLGNLTLTLARIAPAVDQALPNLPDDDRTSANPEFVHAVGIKNVRIGLAEIRKHSEILAGMEAAGDIMIVGAYYDVSTGAVHFLD
ncbi:MAG: carbonic anhydrase family protein [Planctomycetota bacterium]